MTQQHGLDDDQRGVLWCGETAPFFNFGLQPRFKVAQNLSAQSLFPCFSGSNHAVLSAFFSGSLVRFRTKRQLWAYSGFAVQTHDSGEYRSVRGKLQRNRERMTVRGLNDNHNRDLKNLFKSAAISASTHPGPLRDFYVARVEKGMRPTMARLTLARKMAAISLAVWKKGVEFDPQQLQRQAA